MDHSTVIPSTMENVSEDQATTKADRFFLEDTVVFVLEDYNQRIIIAFVVCIVFLVGSIGNALVIMAVVVSRKLRSSTNWFILNLGLCDLLTCLSLPFNVVAMLSRNGWPLPVWICSANAAITLICLNTSVLTLGFIAYNRWYLLTQPKANFQKLYKTRNICFMLFSAWIYSSLLVIAPILAGLGRLGYSFAYKTCTQDTSIPSSDLYSLILGAGANPPVFIAILIIYVRIYRFVSRHSKTMDRGKHYKFVEAPRDDSSVETTSTDTLSSDKQIHQALKVSTLQTMKTGRTTTEETTDTNISTNETADAILGNQSKTPTRLEASLPVVPKQTPRREVPPRVNSYHVTVTKRLTIVVLAFFFCLLPFGVSVLVPPSDPGIPWTGLLVIINSCINPLIYARTLPNFRKVMWSIIRCSPKDIPEPIPCIRRLR